MLSLVLIVLAAWGVLSLLALPVVMLLGRAGREADAAATTQHTAELEHHREDPAQELLGQRAVAGGTGALRR